MAKPPKAFDVWFVAANTVYKGVPYNVVADWVQQGRLAPTDMVRPDRRRRSPGLLSRSTSSCPTICPSSSGESRPGRSTRGIRGRRIGIDAPNWRVGSTGRTAGPGGVVVPQAGGDEDDDVDMIPLIDISMVLLVFFIMLQAAGALPPVDVPEMRYAGQLTNDPNAITINIEKQDEDTVYYSVRLGPVAAKPNHDRLSTPVPRRWRL